jgi:PKD repeat protein
MKANDHHERWWAAGLIVLGTVLLGMVFFMAFSIVSDPGGYYDEWVPAEGPEGPEASFDWAASGSVADFVDTSSSGDSDIVAWAWEFGDGSQSPDPNPSHQFAKDGENTVTLDVVDDNGATSEATGTVETGSEGPGSGTGVIGMNDLADNAIAAIERSAKGAGVVVLVIGMLVVLTMIGGRFVRQGVRALRPIPDKIKVKLRPKELELSAMEPTPVEPAKTEGLASPIDDTRDPAFEDEKQPVGSRTA